MEREGAVYGMRRSIFSLCLALPAALQAQQPAGAGGGMLSERAYYMVFYSGRSEDVTPDLLILLRGAPGWMQVGNSATGRSSMSLPGSDRPVRSSITIGNVHFECSYRPNERILRIGGTDYPLGEANVVVVDRVDAVGGQPTILPPFNLPLPRTARDSLGALLTRLPELQQYIH